MVVNQKLRGKRVLITGGSKGIGRGVASAFATEGANLVIAYRSDEQSADDTVRDAQSKSVKAKAIRADVGDLSALPALVADAIAFLGGIDILVNNAGTLTRHSEFLDIPIESLDKIMAVNLRAPFALTQLVGKQMRDRQIRGAILNISSISANIVTPGLADYECSKAALNMLTKSSAAALAKYGIRVNAIAPGLVATEINRAQREGDASVWTERTRQIPIGRAGTPDDIAPLAVMLVSDEMSWATGSVYTADGGTSAAR